MDEASLARDLVGAILARLPAAVLCRVVAVRCWVGEAQPLSAENLHFHFAAFARGTPAEGAALDLTVEHVPARCYTCGATYLPERQRALCTECGSLDGEILGQTGVMVEEIDVEQEEGEW